MTAPKAHDPASPARPGRASKAEAAATSAKLGIEKETKGTRTKALIKRTVADLVDEKGVDGVVLEDICQRTGLTIGAFYFHFGNKDAALEEVAIDSLRAYYVGLIDAPDSPTLYDEVHTILEASIEVHIKRPRIARLMYVMVPRSNRVYVHWLEARDRLIERLALAMARETGRRTDAPAEVVAPNGQHYLYAQYLMAGAEGFFENAFYGADPQFAMVDLKPANLVRDIAVLWYQAITGKPPRPALVAEAHRLTSDRLPAKRMRRQRRVSK